MAAPVPPTFLETPVDVWVRCEEHQPLPNNEIGCQVPRAGGESRLIITSANHFREGALHGVVIAEVEGGRLVSFPSGDRVTVPATAIEEDHASPVGS